MLNIVAHMIDRDLSRQVVDKFGAFGARTHKAHIASKDIVKLRQFIQTSVANESTDPRHPAVVFLGPLRLATFLRILAHAPNFVDAKRLAFQAYTHLMVKNKLATFKHYRMVRQ